MRSNQFLLYKRDLLVLLMKLSFSEKEVTLSCGRKSNFFIDCKQTLLTAKGHHLSGILLYDMIKELPKCDAIAGVELGGCPLVSAASSRSYYDTITLDAIYVRKESKDHGSKRVLEGNDNLTIGSRVILIEDVVTTGNASKKAVHKLRDHGYVVNHVITLVDRLEGGKENLKDEDVDLIFLYTKEDFYGQTI